MRSMFIANGEKAEIDVVAGGVRIVVMDPVDHEVIRINCGGESIGDWISDTLYAQGGGTVDRGPIEIYGGEDARVYQTERWGTFKVSVPCDLAECDVRLHFAETYHDKVGQRSMTIKINSIAVRTGFDPSIHVQRVRTAMWFTTKNVSVVDGKVTIDISGHAGMLNGIEIGVPGAFQDDTQEISLPDAPGLPRPLH